MLIVPLQPLPSQTVNALLNNQATTLNVYQKNALGLYVDVLLNNALIIGGVIAENLNRIVRSVYLGFIGDLCFIDNEGSTDPVYTGLGTRYSLAYLETTDLLAGEG